MVTPTGGDQARAAAAQVHVRLVLPIEDIEQLEQFLHGSDAADQEHDQQHDENEHDHSTADEHYGPVLA